MSIELKVTRCGSIVAALLVSVLAGPAFGAFEFKKGDRVVYLGNGLADRMQHHGWLETYIQQALPRHELVFRNHGFTGDRINHRPRNKGFMSADDYLTHSKATVIFAFFGYNESYDGKPDEFKQHVAKWVDETRGKNYSGKGAPRIVLFSPIAHENLKDPNLPNGAVNNRRLAAYTMAMSAVAREKNVAYVDLFAPSRALYAKVRQPLTINGIHPTSEGNRQLARVMVEKLLDKPAPTDTSATENLRQAVLNKNWHWFNRYRATDGNDVWGSRARLHNNRATLQRELEQLDVMTANRDKLVWATAQGKSYKVDDSNVPPSLEVKTNFKSPSLKSQGGVPKIGSLNFMTPEETLSSLKFAKGLKGNVFASEKMFPELANPVQLGVDTKGRLWAAAWPTYPKWEPTKEMNDRLLILPDEDRDGVADKCITFAYVHNPTGFEFWNGGVIVASAPDILFLKDTDGDDVADIRIRVLHGIDSADTHHTANNFVYGPCGNIYYQRGVFHVSNVETPWVTNQQSSRSAMYRFNPWTYEFAFHANNSPNPHGIGFDYWGYHYATDGTGGRAYQVKPDGKGGFKMRSLLKKTVRPVPSSGILSSSHMPERYNGTFLICNAIAFLGIKQYELQYNTETGDVNGVEIEDLLVASDRNFRPTDFEVGDDGAVYVSDWCNPIVGHMQHNIRDPSRDHDHGRIFRISAPGRPLMKHVPIDGQPIEKLLDNLKHPINGIRHRTRIELSEHDTKAVIAATKQWMRQFDPNKKEDAHHLMEALWLHQQHNVVNRKLLNQMLNSPEPHARIAAATVKQFWDRNPTQIVSAGDDDVAASFDAESIKDAIVIKTIPEEMRYDKTRIAVKAGQKVKILLVNEDYMPHNLIVGQIGSAEEIGTKAEAMGAEGFKLGFIPKSDKIIAASKMIDYREGDLIEFTAPTTPGDYDIICTFPGHWKLMRGVMKVVRTDAELAAANAAPQPVAKNWKLDDLAGDLAHIAHGRSFAKGKASFDKLGCAQCHKVAPGVQGGVLGPELSESFKKLKGNRTELLQQILDPSKVIEDKYKAWEIETADGDRLFGMITAKAKDHILVVTNPQNPVPQKFLLKDIDSTRQVPLSLMPRGLLNQLTKQEILDLLAYIEAGGNAKHKLYNH